jgi:hypothetical protein
LRGKTSGLEKYIYLNGLKERDPNLFYEVLLGNMTEIIPILYTPTVDNDFLFFGLDSLNAIVGRRCVFKLFAHMEASRRVIYHDRK